MTTMGELLLGQIAGGCSCLIEVEFLILFHLIWDFDYWPLNRGCPLNRWLLNGGSTVHVLIKKAFTYTGTYLLVFLQEIPVTGPGWGRYTKV